MNVLFPIEDIDIIRDEEKGFALGFHSNHRMFSRRFKDIGLPEISEAQECYAELDRLGEVAKTLVEKYASTRDVEDLNDIEQDIERRTYEDCILEHETLSEVGEKGFALGFNAYYRKFEQTSERLLDRLLELVQNGNGKEDMTALRSVLHVHADMGKIAEKSLNEVLQKMTSRCEEALDPRAQTYFDINNARDT